MIRIALFVITFLPLVACGQSGIRDFQMSVKASQRDSLMILSNDTTSTSPKYGTAKFVNPYILIASVVDSLYATALANDSTWLHVYTDTPPPFANNTDTIVHRGVVTIGADTTFNGQLNVAGRIDQRWPINKENVAIGPSVMNSGSVTGDHNVAIGRSSMRDLTTGNRNSALGAGALQAVTTGSDNLGVGEGALQSLTTGQENSAVGRLALGLGGDPDYNVAIGTQSLYFCGTDFNVGIGYNAIGGFDFAFTGGNENVAIGSYAGYGFAGEDNVAIGDSAGYSWAGNNALFIDNSGTTSPLVRGDFAQDTLYINGELGFRDDPATDPDAIALMSSRKLSRGIIGYGLGTSGDSLYIDMVAVADSIGTGGGGDPSVWFETGAVAANDIADEIYHTGDVHIGDATMAGGGKLNVLGYADFRYPTVSLYNIGIGLNALDASMTGNNNIAFGQSALTSISSGSHNYAFGEGALQSLTTGSGNTAIGFNAGNALSTGEGNFFAGFQAGTSYTGGNAVAIGYQAMLNNVSGTGNVAIGDRALTTATSSNNVALGGQALQKLTSGAKNLGIGTLALVENLTGNDNVAVGTSALQNTTTGYQNVAIGTNALLGGSANGGYNNIGIGAGAGQAVTGNGNVLIGSSAMGQNTGSENVAIGVVAGYNNLTGSGNVFIGTTAGYNETGSNKLYIDNSTTASPLIHGDFSTDELFINGKLGYSTEGSTATTLAGRDASEDFTNVTIGTGLSLSAGTLSNTGVISEVDGSITNEGILGVGAGGATSATLITNTATGNPVTLNVSGIMTISESTSSNGGSMTLGAVEVDGSITNELELFQIDGVLQSAGPVTFDMDGASFSITESPANDFDIQINPERVEDIVGGMVTGNTETGIAVTYDDVNAKLNFVVSGASDGNGIFDAANDGGVVPTDMDINITDHIDFELGLLYIDAASLEIGINTQTPDAVLNIESTNDIELLTEETTTSATNQFRMASRAETIGNTPHAIEFYNADADLNSGTSTLVGSITTTRLSSTAAGVAMNFNVQYNATGSTDEVFEIASRESGATTGYVTTRGGVRHDVLTSASTSITLTTGDHVLIASPTAATTVSLPTITTGNIGMAYEILNNNNTFDITIDPSGSQSINGSGTYLLQPNKAVIIRAGTATAWYITSIQ